MKKLFLTAASLLSVFAAMAQCNPQFTWAPAPTGAAPLQASFTNTSTFTPPALPAAVSTRLSFGDGLTQYGFSGTTHHNYAAPGTYNAWMVTSVYDSFTNQVSCRDSVMHQVTVNYQPCYATFTATATGAGAYSFTASMPSATPGAVHSWNFGDGTPVVTGNPVSHTYGTNIPYTVTLNTSAGGCTSAKTLTVNQPVASLNCDSLHAGMQVSYPAPMTVQLSNTSSQHNNVYNAPLWAFGDGATSTSYSPTHLYAGAGTYTITLVNKWKDSLTHAVVCTDTITQPVTISTGGNICAGLYAAMAVNATAPLTLSLLNTSNSTAGLSKTSQWSFGDGGTSTANNTSHTYAAPGTYHILLTNSWRDSLTHAVVCTDTAMQTYTFGPASLCDSLGAYMSVVTTGPLSRNFYNNSSTRAGLSMQAYWAFGDGGTGTGNFQGHTYAAPGTYNVQLITRWNDSLTNALVCADTLIQPVTISLGGSNICDSLLAAMQINTTGPLTISLQNNSTHLAGLSTTAQWSFGDGSTSTASYPSHTYAAAGTYTITLVNSWRDSLTNAVVCSDTAMQTINFGPVSLCDSLNAYMSVVSTGLLSRNFYNNSSARPGLSMQAYWAFGDGGTGTGNVQSHTYPAPGTYNVQLITRWNDSLTNTIVCTDTLIQSITLGSSVPGSLCDSLTAYISVSITGPLSIDLQNASATLSGLSNHAQWYLGDGTTSTANNLSHTYAAPGTYSIILVNRWKDSANNVVCADSIYQQVVLGNPAGSNQISGYITWDSIMSVPAYDTFKVWLIAFDSSMSTLTAIDSTLASYSGGNIPYNFGAQPAGTYLIKAASLASIPGTTGFVPTYHTSSLYWNSATQVVHTGGATTNKNIWMQTGTVTSGPGFIAGNVALGAGRGTNTGVPGMLIFLRNSSSQLVSTTYTDANGDFRFEHLPTGAYSVYPEAINYTTTPAAVVLGEGSLSRAGIDFERTSKEIVPKNITSLKGATVYQDIKVYPNPFRGEITIDNQAGHYSQVSFITVTGQVVYRQAIKQGNNVVATTGLVPGVYFLLINGKEQTARMTITKQ